MDMDELNTAGSAEVIARLATAAGEIRVPNDPDTGDYGTPFVLAPEGYEAKSLEDLMPQPPRQRARRTFLDAASFVAYWQANVAPRSALYATVEPPAFVAIFDHGSSEEPMRADHTATYGCPLSKEWLMWSKTDRQPRKQVEFARFIEDAVPDIVEPSGATMLEIALKFEAKRKVAFGNSVRLDNGQVQLQYEEEIQGSAAKGQIEIPQQFAIAIPVFHGGPMYRIEARLRYRIPSNRDEPLQLWYELIRPDRVLEHAFNEVREQIAQQTGCTVWMGRP